ncbi:cytochrome P450 [Aspergillus karnatakaensis]|uniref:cytochrome P450 n=1 Tax=Aspergillus karnatakaensis TaxID=1810916 RepID=UPI003CCE40F5
MNPSDASFEAAMNKFISSRLGTGTINKLLIQIGSKLLNGKLSTLKPIVEDRSRMAIAREIGHAPEWKRLKAKKIATEVVKTVSSRVIFGEALANSAAFVDVMHEYTSKVVPYAFALRYFNVGPLRDFILYVVHWRHRRELEIATRYITEMIAERRNAQTGTVEEDGQPFDCIQWALEQPVPEDEKTPEVIARRLLTVSAGAVDAIVNALVHPLCEIALHGECIADLREEIGRCLAEEDGGWSQNSMAKMKKFDSFLHECFRISAMPSALTVWRLVSCESIYLDETLSLPKDTLFTFPTKHFLHDSDTFPDADKFDYLRSYNRAEETVKAEPLSTSSKFGYGRQACPGKFYALNVCKIALGQIILNYDVRMPGGKNTRPALLDLDPLLLLDPSTELEFKSLS